MKLVLNPTGFDTSYLDSLNTCFPGWGDEAGFIWAFRRPTFPAADVFVLYDEGVLLAGSALTYRRLRRADGSMLRCATMTGSWTLPAARNRGCFTRVIEASLRIAHERGCPVLNAYVRNDNPSAARLAAAGAAALPAGYLRAAPGPFEAAPGAMQDIPAEDAWRERVPARHCLHYDYSREEWLDQFANRPTAVTCLRVNQDGIAVLETKGSEDRLLELTISERDRYLSAMRNLRARSGAQGRHLSTYSVTPWVIAGLVEAGFENTPGAVMSLATEAGHPNAFEQSPAISIANGDRM